MCPCWVHHPSTLRSYICSIPPIVHDHHTYIQFHPGNTFPITLPFTSTLTEVIDSQWHSYVLLDKQYPINPSQSSQFLSSATKGIFTLSIELLYKYTWLAKYQRIILVRSNTVDASRVSDWYNSIHKWAYSLHLAGHDIGLYPSCQRLWVTVQTGSML